MCAQGMSGCRLLQMSLYIYIYIRGWSGSQVDRGTWSWLVHFYLHLLVMSVYSVIQQHQHIFLTSIFPGGSILGHGPFFFPERNRRSKGASTSCGTSTTSCVCQASNVGHRPCLRGWLQRREGRRSVVAGHGRIRIRRTLVSL